MARGCAGLPDWTDARAYQRLIGAERPAFAWEWLRRDPLYREQALEAVERRRGGEVDEDNGALRWHLHAFTDPRLSFADARPVWAAPLHRWVVPARARLGAAGGDCFELARFGHVATLLVSGAVQRLLLSDGWRSIRLDVTGARLAEAPVGLAYEVSGIAALEPALLVLQRLRALALTGRFAAALHPPFRRAPRLVTLLRAFDGLGAGASHGDLAAVLISPRLERQRWRVHSPSVRSQAQRLARTARAMAAGGFWQLLG